MPSGLNKATLTRLRSPDQLDRAIRLTSPRVWLALGLLALIAAAVLLWSVFGALDTRVAGLGMVLPSGGKVYVVSAERGGTADAIEVVPGDTVAAGDVVAVLRQGTDELDRGRAQAELAALREQYAAARERSEALIAERRRTSAALIASHRNKIDALGGRLEEKRQALGGLRDDLRQGYVTRDTVDKAGEAIDQLRFEIAEVREAIADAEVQLATFTAGQRTALAEQEWAVRKQEIALQRLTQQTREDERLQAPAAGTVSEVAVAAGDRVAAGQPVVSILSGRRTLAVDGFFRAADGKRIVPGMRALVALASAVPAVYGTALGEVTEVSELPVSGAFVEDRLGNAELAQAMMADGAPVYVRIRLLPDPATPSGLAWSSSKGPPFRIGAGTLATPTVTVASQPPINYVAPLLPERIGLVRGEDR